jgi:DNA mismatch repair protein MutS2
MAYAASPLGKDRARNCLPLEDLDTVRRHLRQTEELRVLMAQERIPLSGLRDVVGELQLVADRGQTAEPDFFYRVVDLLRAGLSVRQLFRRNPSALPELLVLADGIEDVPDLREEIPELIDPREGVRDEASEKLATLRSEIRQLRQELRRRAGGMLANQRLRAAFQSEGVTIKNDRYLLPVKAEYRSWVPGPVRDRSQSGSTLYVEPDEITYDGDRLLDKLDQERNEKQRILWYLMRKILDARVSLERLQEALAWVDFTYAKASYAEAFGLTVPEVNNEGILDLREARHPQLLWLARDPGKDHRDVDVERVRKAVVPISVRLGERFHVLIITGPNTGGKTVALKTVGLSVLMALSGIPIAAEAGSRVPLYSSVFADIGDEQSIEQSLSTFSSHLTHVIEILRRADPRTLILLDELGAGTDPIEGAALGRALLDVFREQGWASIITTHIGSLKEYAYVHDGAENACMEFDEGSLKPTYRLLMGVAGSSHALAIARRMGLDERVLERAEADVSREEEPTREIISRMERSRRRVEKERRRAERVRRRAQGTARKVDQQLADLEAEREALRAEAQSETDDAVRSAKERLLPLLTELGSVPKTHQEAVRKLREEVDRLLVGTPLGEKREAFARSLKKGAEVYVPKFRERAKVRKVDKGGRVLTVLLNGLPVELSFDDVSWLEGPSGEDT